MVTGDSDLDGILDVDEINGYMDPEACNYNSEATDAYIDYSFLEYEQIGATDTTRIFKSRRPVAWQKAKDDAEAHGGHIASLRNVRDAMMLASRTGFADTLALDYARELQIGGQVFLWVGDFDGRRYYASQLDTMSLHTWKNDEQIRWDQIQPNLLVVNSQAENDGLQSLLEAASIDKVWLGLTDDDNVGIGEGNWTFLRDSLKWPSATRLGC